MESPNFGFPEFFALRSPEFVVRSMRAVSTVIPHTNVAFPGVSWSMTVPLDKVLSCPSLPSLPGVALKVLELTRDPNVSIARIATAVQNDPAITARVLRTVNSSYYALATPCPSIGRAMSLLGLNTVKSVVLSFSLVDTARRVSLDDQFDLESFWRRGIFSAVASRAR